VVFIVGNRKMWADARSGEQGGWLITTMSFDRQLFTNMVDSAEALSCKRNKLKTGASFLKSASYTSLAPVCKIQYSLSFLQAQIPSVSHAVYQNKFNIILILNF